MYNVTTIGGEILNLDGPLDQVDANAMAQQIEEENNIDVRVVPIESDAAEETLPKFVGEVEGAALFEFKKKPGESRRDAEDRIQTMFPGYKVWRP